MLKQDDKKPLTREEEDKILPRGKYVRISGAHPLHSHLIQSPGDKGQVGLGIDLFEEEKANCAIPINSRALLCIEPKISLLPSKSKESGALPRLVQILTSVSLVVNVPYLKAYDATCLA